MDPQKLAWQILQLTVPMSAKYGVTYKDLSEALVMASQIVTELQQKKQEHFRTTAD
jgi:carbamoylphosphate synthase small subunit